MVNISALQQRLRYCVARVWKNDFRRSYATRTEQSEDKQGHAGMNSGTVARHLPREGKTASDRDLCRDRRVARRGNTLGGSVRVPVVGAQDAIPCPGGPGRRDRPAARDAHQKTPC